MSWSFAKVWNDSLENRVEREMTERDYLWASDIGKAPIDLYLRLKGVPVTNPPNARSKRKFEGGNIWEWVVKIVLIRAGVLMETQEKCEYTYPDLLRVSGKIDFIAGGRPDWEKAQAEIAKMFLPDVVFRATESLILTLKEQYPDGLDPIILEVKSCSTFMFDRYEATGRGELHHALQAFHYLKAKDMREAHVVYVCRDDARLLEIGVLNPSHYEDKYKAFIEQMTFYTKNDVIPPKEPLVVFDEMGVKFNVNWKVTYSQYLSMLYGFENQFSFEQVFKPKVMAWNRVLGRCVRGDKITDKNKDVIADIKKSFPDFELYVEKAKSAGVAAREDVDE